MRETRQSGSEGGEGDLPDPYTRGAAVHPSMIRLFLRVTGAAGFAPCQQRPRSEP
jgi:hypothetical protein